MTEPYAQATVAAGKPYMLVETGTRFQYRPGGDGPAVDDVEPGTEHALPLPDDVSNTLSTMIAGNEFTAGTDASEARVESLEAALDTVLDEGGFTRSGPWFVETGGLRADLVTDD